MDDHTSCDWWAPSARLVELQAQHFRQDYRGGACGDANPRTKDTRGSSWRFFAVLRSEHAGNPTTRPRGRWVPHAVAGHIHRAERPSVVLRPGRFYPVPWESVTNTAARSIRQATSASSISLTISVSEEPVLQLVTVVADGHDLDLPIAVRSGRAAGKAVRDESGLAQLLSGCHGRPCAIAGTMSETYWRDNLAAFH